MQLLNPLFPSTCGTSQPVSLSTRCRLNQRTQTARLTPTGILSPPSTFGRVQALNTSALHSSPFVTLPPSHSTLAYVHSLNSLPLPFPQPHSTPFEPHSAPFPHLFPHLDLSHPNISLVTSSTVPLHYPIYPHSLPLERTVSTLPQCP